VDAHVGQLDLVAATARQVPQGRAHAAPPNQVDEDALDVSLVVRGFAGDAGPVWPCCKRGYQKKL
jgi:hypothetical protein